MGKKEGGPVLGRNLLKTKNQTKKEKRVANQEGFLHTTDLQDGYDWGRMNLQSVTENDTVTDLLNTAEMAGREFDAEKWNVKLLDAQTRKIYIDTDSQVKKEISEEEENLPIPRRPAWAGLTSEELKEKENEAFLEWRRNLASLQESTDCVVTPYEKNLDFWRQLWRVIERSDLIIQIVDARDPLVYRSSDLEAYVKEVSPLKKNLLLINKADFLSIDQRKIWADYLAEKNVPFAFFSAIEEDFVEDDIEDDAIDTDKYIEEEDSREESLVNEVQETEERTSSNTDVLSSDKLIELFRSYKRYESELITVGFIGYPNVGKSSTINKLLCSKKVRVSDTPGKTKHFQTLILEDDITLCDCPGLVMPSVCNSKAGMVLQGILPIDQLRDHVPSINLLLSHIPTHVLEAKYGLVLPGSQGPITSEQVLCAYGTLRGFMTAAGRPDQARAARLLLKDYVSGKLLHCSAPPGSEQRTFHIHPKEERRVWASEESRVAEERRLAGARTGTRDQEIDKQFFKDSGGGVHVKGKKKLDGRLSDKKNKKTKARILYKDLDPKRHGHE